MKRIYRQGDVLLTQVKELPEGLKKKKDLVIMEGEITGHLHEFPKATKGVELLLAGQEMYLNVSFPSPLIHPEHYTIIIEPGMYKIGHEREYSYEEEGLRRVVD